MAPKKSRTAVSANQPMPESQHAPRATRRKRKHSDASNMSERPESSQGQAIFPAKRPRKVRARNGEEHGETLEQDDTSDILTLSAPTVEPHASGGAAYESLEPSEYSEQDGEQLHSIANNSRHVRFGDDIKDKQGSTAQHNTPHPRMTVKRRVTLSPIGEATNAKVYKTTLSRTSLPPTLSQNEDEPVTVVQELQFTTLRQAINARVQRLRNHHHLDEEREDVEELNQREHGHEKLRTTMKEKQSRVEALMLELGAQSQFRFDGSGDVEADHQRNEDMEAELQGLRQELADSKVREYFGELPADDMMVADSQEEISYPRVSGLGAPFMLDATVKHQPDELASTRSPSLDPARHSKHWDTERRRFEDSILALSQEANEAKARLQILYIELQSLGFSEGNVSASSVIQSIRESFDTIRDNLDMSLPEVIAPDASNKSILDILAENVQDFASRLRLQDKELHERSDLIYELRKQIDGLLERLAASEIRQSKLEEQWRELDEGSDSKERDIQDLQEQVESLELERQSLQDELQEKTERVDDLETESGHLEQSVDRLNRSLRNYHVEEDRLQKLVTRMEEEHQEDVSKMNREREATVQEMEERIDNEIGLRSEAQSRADEQSSVIEELEQQIKKTSDERHGLLEQIDGLNSALNAERDGREQAESASQEKDRQVDDLETRVSKLEEELDVLNSTLTELGTVNEAERNQREAAEAELDDRNAEIEQMNERLQHMGIEANNLRQKMFEVQQQNATKIRELEQASSDRDEQYQSDIAMEVTRRDAAEEARRTLEASLLDLQSNLEELEQRMGDTLAGRDARIEELEDETAKKDVDIARLREDLKITEDMLSSETLESKNKREDLEASIDALQKTIADHESKITELHRQAAEVVDLHDSEMDDRNAAVAELNHKVAVLETSVSELETERNGLERRVENEAEQMLQLQAEREEELEALKDAIRDKQTKILVVEEKAREADQRWQDLLDERNHEIDTLRVSNDSKTEVITDLNSQLDSLKAKFVDYVRRSQGRMRNARDAASTAELAIREEDSAMNEEGQKELDTLQRFGEDKTVAATQSLVNQHAEGKARKRGRAKKRKFDSGLGTASDEVEAEVLMA